MNDHINEQIDFDVEEFVPGVVMATSLKTLGYPHQKSRFIPKCFQ